jgi:hypothetical protein
MTGLSVPEFLHLAFALGRAVLDEGERGDDEEHDEDEAKDLLLLRRMR